MTTNEIKDKFDEIKINSTYRRVSDSHPLELYLGLDERGFKTLRFNGNFDPVNLHGNDLLEVKQIKNKDNNSILFIFNSFENYSVLYRFCEDLINQAANILPSNGYKILVNRFNLWKRLFNGNNSYLGESEVIGLIGELLFLKDFAFKKYGISDSLEAWTGPEEAHKDFSIKEEWYEIKGIINSKKEVTISSIEQLDSKKDGHLYVYMFEKMSPEYEGISLNNLVRTILDSIEYDRDKDIFAYKLKKINYTFNEIYDNLVYVLKKENHYIVNDAFPRIKASNLPKAISNVKYTNKLSDLDKYKE